jgi:hypothetical protein
VKLLWLLCLGFPLFAATYQADPTNYRTQLSVLQPGDTLVLNSGTYTLLNVNGLNGTPSAWITITGPASGSPAVIAGSACCNTVEIINSSYLAITNLTIDSKGIADIFGISAKGSSNLVHDILIENNLLIGQNANQMTDGISTKTPTWGWIIRHNTILGAGTGMYLGDSNGTQPFIGGLIESNLFQDTIGYNVQIKHQYSRPAIAGMPTDPTKTIIRNNVFIKNNQPSPYEDEPNLMLGAFPSTGLGSSDMYEVYGNFFYHNPREALLQAEGRVSIHDNVFVDGQYAAIVLRKNYLPLSVAHVYNNTIYSAERGIYFGSTAAVEDAVTGNLVFAATPISGPIANVSGNIVDSFGNAVNYVNAPSFTLGTMDFYPKAGSAQGSALDLSAFASETDSALDFNGTAKSDANRAIVFRGAYAGEGGNPGWKLQAAIKPSTTPSSAPGMLQSLRCSPDTVSVGQNATCTGTLVSPVSTPSVIALGSSSSAITVPASITITTGALSAAFSAAAIMPGSATVTGTLNSGLSSAVLTSVDGVPLVTGLTCSPSSLAAGSLATCSVTVSPAPTTPATVLLSTNNSYASVPSSVAVAPGATGATFTAATTAVTTAVNVIVTATSSGSVASDTLTVNPVVVSAVGIYPASVASGAAAIGTVYLTLPAPANGATVTLTSSSASAVVPASVTIPAGATSAQFSIATGIVATRTSATLSAAFGGVTKSSTLTVNPIVVSSLALSPAVLAGGVPPSTNTVYLTGPAVGAGAVVTLRSSSASAVVPASVTIPAGATSAHFSITTTSVAAATSVTISAAYGGVTKTATLTVNPAAASLLVLYPTVLVGGVSSTANTVYLNAPAPSTGALVTLTSSDPSATVPASVNIVAGATSATFGIKTTSVASSKTVTISAAYGGVKKTAILTLNPVALASLLLYPTAFVGGVPSSSSAVYLNGPAPSSGAVVTLSSSDPSAAVPATVTVPAGATSVKFTITTSNVGATTAATISAACGGVTKTAPMTVNPVGFTSVILYPTAVIGGVTSTANTVNLNGPAPSTGAVVTLKSSDASAAVPASVIVSAGATSASFSITTASVAAPVSVTISAAYGGVTKAATLTLNPVLVSSLLLYPTAFVGGVPSSASAVYLNAPAPPAGMVVALSSSDPSAAVPATVVVPAGATSMKFTITTTNVAATTAVTISAACGGVTKTAAMTVNPVAVSLITLYPTTLAGGASSSANTVYLNGPAPVGGAVVRLNSSDASATPSASVIVPEGATSAKFNIATTSVASSTTATISATYGAVSKTAPLIVN